MNFVEAFEIEYNKEPGNAAAAAWVDVFQYADAVKRADSFGNKKVIKALEGHKFTLLLDEEHWREWDHQGRHPTFVAIGKSPSDSKNEWDLFEIIAEQKGEDVARSREENPVELVPFCKSPNRIRIRRKRRMRAIPLSKHFSCRICGFNYIFLGGCISYRTGYYFHTNTCNTQ